MITEKIDKQKNTGEKHTSRFQKMSFRFFRPVSTVSLDSGVDEDSGGRKEVDLPEPAGRGDQEGRR